MDSNEQQKKVNPIKGIPVRSSSNSSLLPAVFGFLFGALICGLIFYFVVFKKEKEELESTIANLQVELSQVESEFEKINFKLASMVTKRAKNEAGTSEDIIKGRDFFKSIEQLVKLTDKLAEEEKDEVRHQLSMQVRNLVLKGDAFTRSQSVLKIVMSILELKDSEDKALDKGDYDTFKHLVNEIKIKCRELKGEIEKHKQG